MDIENEFEQQLVFRVEIRNDESDKLLKQKKVKKMAKENFKKIVMDRLEGKTGEC